MKELTKDESKILKGIAILFMIGLHLYNTLDYENLYQPLLYIGDKPLIYYISFLFDACVPIYCFCSGYAMYLKQSIHIKDNIKRIFKFVKRYWIVLVLTCIVGIILHNPSIPDNVLTFIGNLTLINISYVGAWWFVQTYVLLILLTPFIIKMIDKYEKITLLVVLVIYFIAFYFRIMNPVRPHIFILDVIINALVLLGTSLFPFVVGMYFYKNLIISKLRTQFSYNNIIAGLIIIVCILLHIFIKNMIIAPFIAIIFILGFSLIHFHPIIRKILLYFGNHSTNLWLVHMQYYMIFTPTVVFYTHTVIGCLVILLGMCIITSYLINFLENVLFKYLIH